MYLQRPATSRSFEFNYQYEYRHIKLTYNNGYEEQINIASDSLRTLYVWKDESQRLQLSPTDMLKLDHWIEQKEDFELNRDHNDPTIDHELQTDNDGMFVRVYGHLMVPLSDAEQKEQLALLYDSKDLTVQEVEHKYGADPMSNVIYLMTTSSQDYWRERLDHQLSTTEGPDRQVDATDSALQGDIGNSEHVGETRDNIQQHSTELDHDIDLK